MAVGSCAHLVNNGNIKVTIIIITLVIVLVVLVVGVVVVVVGVVVLRLLIVLVKLGVLLISEIRSVILLAPKLFVLLGL